MDDTLIQPAPSRKAIDFQPKFAPSSLTLPSGRENWPVWRPLVATLLLSLLIRKLDLDQKVSALFYDSVNRVWPFETAQPWLWFYRNGTLPPLIVGTIGALIAIFGSRLAYSDDPNKVKQIRLSGLFLALLLIIGPGLLVNASLKSVWGRPRPLQCAELAGRRNSCRWASGPVNAFRIPPFLQAMRLWRFI